MLGSPICRSPSHAEPNVIVSYRQTVRLCKIGTGDDVNLGFLMALFSSPCKPPILCPKFHRIRAIQRPFSSKSLISKTLNFETPRISISAPAKLINTPIRKAKFRSSLSSPGELDEGVPPSVIIFVKVITAEKYTLNSMLKFLFACHRMEHVKYMVFRMFPHSHAFLLNIVIANIGFGILHVYVQCYECVMRRFSGLTVLVSRIGLCILVAVIVVLTGAVDPRRRVKSRIFTIWGIKVITNKKTKQPLGFAYVWFTKEEHAQAAVEEMNGKFYEGRFLYVSLAKPGSCKPRPKPTPYKF
ncbi:UNVERIFIED_CONTAM: hypothetical protein Slati_1067300 [Sesamum latifolium]|uniref:RRM domain-containing protein n=1 Tax=Sesamum latifolium TaxID=2727402 RepID=A0AAW2XU31_9LAMI